MKQLLPSLLLLVSALLLGGRVAAQQPQKPQTSAATTDKWQEIGTLMDTESGAILPAGPDLFITDKTLNHFAAKRQAYYLSGATNLSLFENFAIANVSDGTLQVGRNFKLNREQDLVNELFTVGVQSNIANNLANLFSSSKLANEIGLPLSYTHFVVNATVLHLSKRPDLTNEEATRQRELEQKRVLQYALIKQGKDQDFAAIGAATHDESTRKDAEGEASKKAADAFFDAELALIEKAQPSFRTAWYRLQAFVPVTSSVYQVAPSGTLDFVKQDTRKWSAGVSGGAVWERYGHKRTIFLNGSFSAVRTNAVEQKTEDVQTYTQYGAPTVTPPAGQLYTSGDGDKVYVGDFRERWTYPLKAQAIYLFKSKGDSRIGLDMQGERYIGSYARTNVVLGIPVFLKGSGDAGVNIEPQVKFRDVSKHINGSDRVTVGLSVALPFGSIVH